jgi:hypothetical protein
MDKNYKQIYEYRLVRLSYCSEYDFSTKIESTLSEFASNGWKLHTIYKGTESVESTCIVFERFNEEYKLYNDEVSNYINK